MGAKLCIRQKKNGKFFGRDHWFSTVGVVTVVPLMSSESRN